MSTNKFPRRLLLVGVCVVLFTYVFMYFTNKSEIVRKEIIAADAAAFDKLYTGATIHTTMGDIDIEFLPNSAPKTVYNFITLAEEKFYNGTKFHYVLKNILIQGGDPLTKLSDTSAYGTGGPGYFLPDEKNNIPMERGAMAMAQVSGHMSGSQFFILVAPAPSLQGEYTVFAMVTKGFDVLDAINNIKTNGIIPIFPVEITGIALK